MAMKSNIDKDKTKQMLIDKYISCLKADELPWIKGWKNLSGNRNGISNRAYKGKNALLLAIVAADAGWNDRRWMTFNQIKEYREKHNITGEMFKGEAKGLGVPITYYGVYSSELKKMISFEDYKKLVKEEEINPKNCYIKPWRNYYVFNGDIINGLEPDPELEHLKENAIDADVRIGKIIENMGVNYIEEGSRAYYQPSKDTVVVPPSGAFRSPEYYYSTQLHELCHATGHASRLNRDTLVNNDGFGNITYAKEELRAEIASSFICAEFGLGMDEQHVNNHAAYIQSWIEVLEKEPEELFKAIDVATGIEEYIMEKAEIKVKEKQLDQEVPSLDVVKKNPKKIEREFEH